MSSKAPYVSEEYRHLLSYQQNQQGQTNIYGQNIYFQPQPQVNHQYNPNHQYFMQQQQIHNQPIVFLPSKPLNNVYPQPRASDDFYAADEPNTMYPSLNSHDKPYFQNKNQLSQNTPQTPKDQNEIIHKVQYGDTLEGLSLIYDTSIAKIRQRNNIEGDSIYYLKELVIPNPKASPLQTAKTQELLIQEFMGHMTADERSDKTARFYLNDNDWEMEKALKAYRADLEWERTNKVQLKAVPLKSSVKKDYQQMELFIKKKV